MASPPAQSIRGFYSIVDLAFCASHGELRHLLGRLFAAGSRVFQLRGKSVSDSIMLGFAETLVDRVRALPGAVCLINDRVDIALAVAADGVHLGQDDLPIAEARELLGPNAVIGLSTHSLAQVRAAMADTPSYIGFGPVFATRTKAKPDPAQGLANLRDAVAHSHCPVVAIGGIGTDNVDEVWGTGVHAIAAIAAVLDCADPEAVVRRLLRRCTTSATASPKTGC